MQNKITNADKIKIDSKLMKNISFGYILIPLAVFAVGFLKPVYGIIMAAAIGAVLCFVWKQEKENALFEIDRRTLIMMLIVIPVLMLVCGQGGIFAQTPDWHGRNAMLHDLIEYRWPVYYDDGSSYTYYFAFALIPAVAGKLLGFKFAYFIMWLISSFGVMLIYLYLVKITKADTFRKQVLVLLVLLFFGNGEDLRFVAEDVALGIIRYFSPDFAKPSYILMFTPNARSFALVFNQCIASFMAICMFFDEERRIENFFVLGVGLLMFSPFMTLFMVPVVCIALAKEIRDNKKSIIMVIKRLFSIQNLIMLLMILPVLMLFLIDNITGDKPDELKFQFINFGKNLYYYVVFILCEFLLFSFAIVGKYKKNPYWWVVNIVLAIMPWFKLGLWNDLNSRATSVGMFIIMVMSICFLFDDNEDVAKPRMKVLLCSLLVIASICPANWYLNIIKSTANNFANHNMEANIANDYITYEHISERSSSPDILYNTFTFNAKDKLFFKYLAKARK